MCGTGLDTSPLLIPSSLDSMVAHSETDLLPRFPKSGSKATFLQLPLSLGLSSGGAQDMLAMERKNLRPVWP